MSPHVSCFEDFLACDFFSSLEFFCVNSMFLFLLISFNFSITFLLIINSYNNDERFFLIRVAWSKEHLFR